MFPMFVRFATVAAITAFFVASGARAQAQPEIQAPDLLVKNVTLEVVDIILKDKDIQKGDRKKVIALIEAKVLPHFNFQAMTSSAVGRNWDKASAEQKTRLIDEFKTLLVRTYASALASYSSQKFDFRPLRAKPTDTDVTVNVRVGGISLVANYRTEFDNLIRETGVEGLIKALVAKNNSQGQPTVAGAQKK